MQRLPRSDELNLGAVQADPITVGQFPGPTAIFWLPGAFLHINQKAALEGAQSRVPSESARFFLLLLLTGCPVSLARSAQRWIAVPSHRTPLLETATTFIVKRSGKT